MQIKLRGVHEVKRKLADGSVKVHYYAWRGGPRLEGEPGSETFLASYFEATRTRSQAPRQNTVADLIHAYRRSPEFKTRAESTRREYARFLKIIDDEFGTMPIRALSDLRARGVFLEWRDTMARTPRTADYGWSVLNRLFSFSVDRGKIARNPCTRAGRLYTADRTEALWSQEQLDRLFATAPPEISAAVAFALWTGQRMGDCLKARWADIIDGRIRIRQGKTRASPASPDKQRIGSRPGDAAQDRGDHPDAFEGRGMETGWLPLIVSQSVPGRCLDRPSFPRSARNSRDPS